MIYLASFARRLVVFFRQLYHYNFPISIPQFRSVIDLPITDPRRPHPALLNAIFLLACQHSQDSESMQYQGSFITRAYSYIEDKQSHMRRPLDFILAISLMARYSLNAGDVHRARALADGALYSTCSDQAHVNEIFVQLH